MQARYRVAMQALDRGRTLVGFSAVASAARLKKCIQEGDVANACYLAADLLASGQAVRLSDALADACSSSSVMVPALVLGAAEDVVDFVALAPSADVANDAGARHLAVQAVVRLCLLSSRPPPTSCPRGQLLVRQSGAKLRDLQAEAVKTLREAGPSGETGLLAKLASAMEHLRAQEHEPRRLRLASFVARQAPATVPALVLAASSRQPDHPHARLALALHACRPKVALLLAALAGPDPLVAPPWTAAERNNVTYAVLRAHVLFEAIADGAADARDGRSDPAEVALSAVDPDVGLAVDATFRRKARLNALFRV